MSFPGRVQACHRRCADLAAGGFGGDGTLTGVRPRLPLATRGRGEESSCAH